MVMETPSPQCVGLEFVRQYYTVLNKAPLHLHRFFSHNSSFMHGGHNSMSEPIIGQADIHKMIMSLNFRDCHAKIRMVDAQATLGDGVVIQVTGELSNNGNPMRRFMQTFVLAPQTPKKYYVHNDIFRYQDEVFSDEEGGDEAGSEVEEDLEAPLPPQNFTAPSATVNGSAHPPEPEPTPPAVPQAPTPVAPQVPTPVPTDWGSQTQQSLREVAPVPVTGSSATTATTPPVVAPPLSPTPPAPATTEPVPEAPPTPEKDDQSWGTPASDGWGPSAEPQSSSWDEPAVPQKETPDPDPPQPDPVQQPVSNEPKTYANLFKSNQVFTSPAAAPPPVSSTSQPPSTQPTPPAPPQTQSLNRVEINNRTPTASSANAAPSQPQSGGGFTQRTPRNTQGRGPPRDRPYRPNSEDNSELESLGGEERRRTPMPDSQQIFVGNLPHTAGEEELKAEFSRFGKIVDVRINTAKGKTGPKGQVPNFGFITFDDESAVTRALHCRPIHLNGEHRLNVEEKKARLRMDGGMGRPNSGRGGMGGSGGMRQGPPGGLQGRGGGRPNFSRDSNRGGPGGPRGGFVPRR